MSIVLWAQEAVFTHVIADWDRFMQVMYLGRAPRTKETLPDFLKRRRVTRHPLVFRGLTGSQRTPGFGVSQQVLKEAKKWKLQLSLWRHSFCMSRHNFKQAKRTMSQPATKCPNKAQVEHKGEKAVLS